MHMHAGYKIIIKCIFPNYVSYAANGPDSDRIQSLIAHWWSWAQWAERTSSRCSNLLTVGIAELSKSKWNAPKFHSFANIIGSHFLPTKFALPLGPMTTQYSMTLAIVFFKMIRHMSTKAVEKLIRGNSAGGSIEKPEGDLIKSSLAMSVGILLSPTRLCPIFTM